MSYRGFGCYDRDGNPISVERWSELTSSGDDYRRIGFDQVGQAWVSTVWLGIDHRFFGGDAAPPIIFETMVFAYEGPGAEDTDHPCMRYCTEAEALEGHSRTVADVRAGRLPWFMGRDAWDDIAQDPCPICGDAWHGLDHPISGCPGEFASETEVKEWKRRNL